MDIYAQNILDHYKNPRNFGSLADAQVSHEEANYACGDKLSIDLKMKGEKLAEFKFKGAGCAISQAAMSILSEQILGKKRNEILKINFEDIKRYLGVPIGERRKKCAALGLMTVQRALLQKTNKKKS